MSNVTSFAHAPTQPCLLVVSKYPENAKGQNKGESIDEVYENLIKRMKWKETHNIEPLVRYRIRQLYAPFVVPLM